jgi:hypothetical protein
MSQDLAKVAVASEGPAYNIQAEAVWIGEDLLVYIWGGERPHIGAVAMAEPRPSLADPEVTSASSSVFTYLGHKEDVLAKQAAESLAAALGAKVVVTAGIHWDDLDQAAIETVLDNSRQLLSRLAAKLKR